MRKSSSQVIRRYSITLFELARDAHVLPDVSRQAEVLYKAFDEEIMDMFVSPSFDEFAKREVLDTALEAVSAHDILRRILALILANRRFLVAREILQNFVTRADEELGICRASISSAAPMDAATLEEFENTLSENLKKKVFLVTKTDESLKAGFVINIGNTQVDASLRARLARLKESLIQGV